VYLDNVAVSGLVIGDLAPPEMAALRTLERAQHAGTLKLVTSRESHREQERTADPTKRAALEAARGEVSVVPHDLVILGAQDPPRPGIGAVGPLISDIVDEPLFADLKRMGLKAPDAKHFVNAAAAKNSCDFFVTTDAHFLDRRESLEARCTTLRVRTPTALVAELGLDARTDGPVPLVG